MRRLRGTNPAGAASSPHSGPLRVQEGEAVGVALLAVDALPAAQGRLAAEAGGLGRPRRGDVPRLDEEVQAGDGQLLERERHHRPQRVRGEAAAPAPATSQ